MMQRKNKQIFIFVPPKGGWRWFVLFAVFIVNCITDGITLTFGIFVEPFLTNLIGNYFTVVLICAANVGVYHFLRPFVCGLANKYSERTVGILGGIIAATGYGLSTFQTKSKILILTNGVIGGIGLSMIYVPTKIVLGLYFTRQNTQYSIPHIIATSGYGFGMMFLAPILEYFTLNYSWKYAYYIITCLLLLTSFLALFYLPLNPMISTPNEPIRSALKRTASRTRNKTMYNYFKYLNQQSEAISPSQLAQVQAENAAKKESIWRVQYENFINCLTCNRCTKTISSRPLYRGDIFFLNENLLGYKASVDHIPINQTGEESRDSHRKTVQFHLSVTRIREEEIDQEDKPLINSIKKIFSSDLLKSTAYHIYLIASGVSFYGFMGPLVYLRHRASFNGIDDEIAIWLYAALGFGRAVASILMEILPVYPRIKIEIIYMCISGLICILGCITTMSGFPQFEAIYYNISYCMVFGFCFSTLSCVRPLILLSLFGMDHLTNAFGLQILIISMSSSLAISINGFILQIYDEFSTVFITSGIALIISGLLFALVVFVRKCEGSSRHRRRSTRHHRVPTTRLSMMRRGSTRRATIEPVQISSIRASHSIPKPLPEIPETPTPEIPKPPEILETPPSTDLHQSSST